MRGIIISPCSQPEVPCLARVAQHRQRQGTLDTHDLRSTGQSVKRVMLGLKQREREGKDQSSATFIISVGTDGSVAKCGSEGGSH